MLFIIYYWLRANLRKLLSFCNATIGFPMKWCPKNKCRNSLLTCHYPGTVWLVLLIGWSKFPPPPGAQPIRSTSVRSGKWHFISMEFLYSFQTSFCTETNVGISKCWSCFIKQIQSWKFYIYLVDILVLNLGCWFLSHYLGCWKQQLASSCTHNMSGGIQAAHENLLVGWNTYVFFLNEFLFDCLLELFCIVGYFYWDWSLLFWYTADSKKNKYFKVYALSKRPKKGIVCVIKDLYLHAQ